MAKPLYPVILTQADWNKKKGLFAKAAVRETGLGALMQQCEALYKAVSWDKLDVSKALAGGATGDKAREGYGEAYNEFTKKVTPLAAKAKELENKAAATEITFRGKKTIPSSSTAHVGKVKEAAKLLNAQALAIKGELEAFTKVMQLPTVEESMEAAWFSKLNRLSSYKNTKVLAWTTNADLRLSVKDGKPNSALIDLQNDLKKEIAIVKDSVAKLNALKSKRLEKSVGYKQLADLWRQASDAFLPMKPGMQGIIRAWSVTQTQLAGSGGQHLVTAWETQHPAANTLHKAVERILHEEEVTVNALDEAVDKIAAFK